MAERDGDGGGTGHGLDHPDWERDGQDWPHRAASRFVEAAGLRWHIQEFGDPDAAVLLLLHGIGGATHSWRGLAPLLAGSFRVLAPDLPGHGFTDPLSSGHVSLPGMAAALAALLDRLGAAPVIGVGHSTGAALLLRMSLDYTIEPALLVSINGALEPPPGPGSRLFPLLARPLLLNRVTPRLIAGAVGSVWGGRFIDKVGSRLDPAGIALYKSLLVRPGHVAGALAVLANWDLATLHRDLPKLRQRVLLLAGAQDWAILPQSVDRLREHLRNARAVNLPELGHVAHEEAPEQVAALILQEARASGLLPPEPPSW